MGKVESVFSTGITIVGFCTDNSIKDDVKYTLRIDLLSCFEFDHFDTGRQLGFVFELGQSTMTIYESPKCIVVFCQVNVPLIMKHSAVVEGGKCHMS
jgi:hypothetical protein